jgi:hypothetical protein
VIDVSRPLPGWRPASREAPLVPRASAPTGCVPRAVTRTDAPTRRGTGEPLRDVLGVGRNATTDEIHRAYTLQARLVHPDRHLGAADEVQAGSHPPDGGTQRSTAGVERSSTSPAIRRRTPASENAAASRRPSARAGSTVLSAARPTTATSFLIGAPIARTQTSKVYEASDRPRPRRRRGRAATAEDPPPRRALARRCRPRPRSTRRHRRHPDAGPRLGT